MHYRNRTYKIDYVRKTVCIEFRLACASNPPTPPETNKLTNERITSERAYKRNKEWSNLRIKNKQHL